MDDEYYIPNAFFAFQSNILKCDARQIIAPIVMKSLGLYDKKASTPWKFNLFHIDEFEVYSIKDLPEAIRKLKDINGRLMIKPIEITCMSSHDITLTRYNAQMLLNDNPTTQKVVDIAKDMNLNYIIHGVYEDKLSTRFNYKDDTKVYEALTGIVTKLADTKIALHSKDFKKQFYVYKKNDEFEFIFS
jgi:hypothetical protein